MVAKLNIDNHKVFLNTKSTGFNYIFVNLIK